VSSLNGLSSALNIYPDVAAAGSTINIPVPMPQGRLTLVSGVPVMTANETAKTTVYYDCFKGNLVPYFDGTNDQVDAVASCEVSTALQSSSTGVLNNAGVFDAWWVHSGTNRICFATNGSGGGWASDTAGSNTARGSGYSQLDTTTRPYITNKNSITHCYNGAIDYGSVSANQATYLGTIYTTTAGQTGMAFSVSGSGGGGNVLGLFNAYNQVKVHAISIDSTANWGYSSATWRKADASSSNAISWIDGLQRSSIDASYLVLAENGSGGGGATGCLVDWSSGAPTTFAHYFSTTGVASQWVTLVAQCPTLPQIGYHTIQAIESSYNGAATVSFYGANFGALSPANGQQLIVRLEM
jgi:hypothetical protein